MDITFKIQKPFNAEEIKTGIKEVINAATNLLSGREPEIFITSINTTTAEVKIYFWCKDVTKTEYARNDVFSAVQNRLEEKGVKIV